MLKDTSRFNRIEEFIDHIKLKESVIGIVEYGPSHFDNMDNDKDYTMTIIFDKSISTNICGVHFHIAGIPINCMLLSKKDFKESYPFDNTLYAHLNCRILYDRSGDTQRLLNGIEATWSIPEPLTDYELSNIRYTFKHALDKLTARLQTDPTYSHLCIYSTLEWFIECYGRIKSLEIGRHKLYLDYMKLNDTEIYDNIERIYSTTDIRHQLELLGKIGSMIVSMVGCLWQDDETLFHYRSDGLAIKIEQMAIYNFLFD